MVVPLIMFFITGKWQKEWLIGSPIGPIAAIPSKAYHLAYSSLGIATIGALLVCVISLPWFVRQIRNFQPPKQNTANESQTDEA
jgi:ABC-type Fe3+ transport system permease subunit